MNFDFWRWIVSSTAWDEIIVLLMPLTPAGLTLDNASYYCSQVSFPSPIRTIGPLFSTIQANEVFNGKVVKPCTFTIVTTQSGQTRIEWNIGLISLFHLLHSHNCTCCHNNKRAMSRKQAIRPQIGVLWHRSPNVGLLPSHNPFIYNCFIC